VLDGLSPRSVVQIRSYTPSAARHVHYHAGDRVFEAGNRADGLYTVVSGKLEVSQTDPETGVTTRREVGPGGHVGERLILGETRRVATVRALEDSQILVLDRDEFLRLAESFIAFRQYFETYFRDTLGIEWRPELMRQTVQSGSEAPTAKAS
jgi:NADH dehydrogenase